MRDASALDMKIGEWRARMAAGGIKSPAVLDELESHLREDVRCRIGSWRPMEVFAGFHFFLFAASFARRQKPVTS